MSRVVRQGHAEDRAEDAVGAYQPSVVFILFLILCRPHTPSSCLPRSVNMSYGGLFSFLFTPRYLGERNHNKSVI